MTKTMDRSKIAALMERNGRIFYKRWGYPLRLVLILKDAVNAKPLLQKMCMDQNKVIVVARDGQAVPYEHTNMKVVRYNSSFFNPAALAFLATKRSKKQQKGIDFVFTDDVKFDSFVKSFGWLLTSKIEAGRDLSDLEKIAVRLVGEKKDKDKAAIL